MNNIGLLSSLLTTTSNSSAMQHSMDGLSSNAKNLLNQINNSWLNGGQLINRSDQIEQKQIDHSGVNKAMSRQPATAIGGENELIKRIKEKSDMYMLQQQQIKFINGHLLAQEQKRSSNMNDQQIPSHNHHQQQQQLPHLSKEYILSQVRAQQKQENTIKQHQKQQQQRQQQEAMLIKQQQQMLIQQQQNYQKLLIEASMSAPTPMAKSDQYYGNCDQEIDQPSTIEMNLNNGTIKNIPPSMLVDQFGMLGLVMLMRQCQQSQQSASVSYPSHRGDYQRNVSMLFAMDESWNGLEEMSILDEHPNLPPEYRVSSNLSRMSQMDKLGDVAEPTVALVNSSDDLLFYMFYICCKSDLQIRAHELLTSRGWHFHAKSRAWIKAHTEQLVDSNNNITNSTYYQVFEPNSWSIRTLNLNEPTEHFN